jgi:hypothetical protein
LKKLISKALNQACDYAKLQRLLLWDSIGEIA